MISKLDESNEFKLGVEVTGKVSLAQDNLWIENIQSIIREYGEINLLIVLNENASWGVKAGVEDLNWMLKNMKFINKIAIVSSSNVWKWLTSIDGFFAQYLGIGEKHFEHSDIDQAWTWINQD